MDDRIRYVAMEIYFPEDSGAEEVEELYNHLYMNGYNFYLATEPGFEQIMVLLISEDETGYIDTILKDRNISYEYK